MPRRKPHSSGYPSPSEADAADPNEVFGSRDWRRGGKGKGAAKGRDGNAEVTSGELLEDEDLGDLGVPLDAVVKVWTIHSTPNFSLPWQRCRQMRSSGSGFVVDLKRRCILTNAHCVEWHALVKVQRRGTDTKYLAKVLHIGWDCDTALLTVEDDEFWEGVPAVELNPEVPHLEEPVLCVGFPVGGDTISVTKGVVSRVEMVMYLQTCEELLGIQIDAAINSGNSGGPAFNAMGQCMGMAFQTMSTEKAENVGYIIPTVVIMHFLTDLLKHGKYTGFPTLGIEIQSMENPCLREAYGMAAKQKGVLVKRIAPMSSVAKVLCPDDVVLAFDGEAIGNDGTVMFRPHERVGFSWLLSRKFFKEPATLKVLRNGEEVELHIDELEHEAELVPVHLHDTPHSGPSYLIVAGLVFTTLSLPFLLAEFGMEWDQEAPVEMVHAVMYQRATSSDEQLVVLTQLLSHDLTVGYEDLENLLVHSLNDTKVRNLAHLRELIDTCQEEHLQLALDLNFMLSLRTKDARLATEEVLEKHWIPAAMSCELQAQPPVEQA